MSKACSSKTFCISIALVIWGYVAQAQAQAWDASLERDALRQALEKNTSCNTKCATGLAQVIVDQGIEEGLDLVATLQKAGDKPTTLQLALLYELMRRSATRGEKIVSSHGACANECDKLNADAVALARAGALGPMLKGGKVDVQVLQDPRILQIYMKYIKPIPADKLPWQFKNDDWWKRLSNTA
jgi:hypothetical protein